MAEAIQQQFVNAIMGKRLPVPVVSKPMEWIQDSGELGARLHTLFESEGIQYFVTGGVSSSIHGDPRTTRDLNVVVQINLVQLDRLVYVLEQSGFYVPHAAVEDVKRGASTTISIVDSTTIESADIIINPDTPFDRAQMLRRSNLEGAGFYICSAEDCILQKLRWRRQSQSEKPWTDVLGILKIQQDTLDFEYLNSWASHLDIQDDLEQAIAACKDD